MLKLFAILFVVYLTINSAFSEQIKIGLMFFKEDPRYEKSFAYARIPLRSKNSPTLALKLAMEDTQMISSVKKLEVSTYVIQVTAEDIMEKFDEALRKEIQYFILDFPSDVISTLSQAARGKGIVLINTTAREDFLRSKCSKNLYHSVASNRMISDSLAQYLADKKAKKILVIHGGTEEDLEYVKSFKQSLKRLRLNFVDERLFDISTNPSLREKNNIALLTGGKIKYDFVFVADSIGEFARYVPYQTKIPRPVIGSSGLVPLEWHWSLERYGAPQVNSRFERLTDGKERMNWQDWSIWVAAKSIVYGRIKASKNEDDIFNSRRFRVDGSTGRPLTFRKWSKQLRIPILLTTQNAVIEIAPLDGFLHQTNTLDSLGYDEKEFSCE